MKMSLIEFKNHFEGKTTLVFQYNNEKYIINGCQIFLEENKDDIFEEFKVDLKYQTDVNESLEKLNGNVNEEDLIYIINLNHNFIKFIPHDKQTYEMAMIAIKKHGSCIYITNPNLQDYEMVFIAVNNWSYALKFVREDLKDYELCKIAVYDSGSNLKHVPKEIQDYELCKFAYEQDKNNIIFVKCDDMRAKLLNEVQCGVVL